MTKKIIFKMLFGAIATISFYSFSPFDIGFSSYTNLEKECKSQGEEIFNAHVEECLAVMETAAKEHSAKGVAVVAFVPGEKTASWNSRMRVVGTLNTEKHNFLAIASGKAAEMAVTLENSGNGIRQPLVGELGYKGGVIKKVDCGYLIASFSGAPSEIDVEISKAGVAFLSKYY